MTRAASALPDSKRAGKSKGNADAPAKTDKPPSDLPMGRALFRVMRAIMFQEVPLPELDALPMAQLRLMWTVYYVADATMKDFSERLGVSQSTVTQLADRLVRRGLIERHHDANDRRVVRLRASAVGQALMDREKAQHNQTLIAVWEALSSQEQDEVMRGLEVLWKRAEEVRAAQGRPLPPWIEKSECADGENAASPETSQPQPVDLMARRVRGRAPIN